MSDKDSQEFVFTTNHQMMLNNLTPFLLEAINTGFRETFGLGLLSAMPLGKHDPKRIVVIREDQRPFTKAQELWLKSFQDGWRSCVAAMWVTSKLEIASDAMPIS